MTEQTDPKHLILTIDDDDMMRLMLQQILQRDGFSVICASNGQEGIDMIKSQSPVLVLLDVMMPVMNGFDCLKAIREINDFALLPIVMLTGADDYDSISKSYLLGATDFIAKPINWTTLSHRLRYLLRASSALTLLAKSEAELRMAQKIAHLGSWEWVYTEEKVTCACQAIKVLSADMLDNNFADFFQSFTQFEAEKLSLALERCRVHKQSFQLQLIKHSDVNSDRIYLIHGEPIVIDTTVTRILGTIQDITERQRIQEQIRFLSYYDQLTGLPNRIFFKEVIEQAIAFSCRNHTQLAVLFIAIDRFKRINETLGPGIGDHVLKLFTDRLVEQARQCPFIDANAGYPLSEVNVFRPSGNEFTILLNKIHDTRDSIKVAQSIIDVMVLPFRVEDREIFLSINIGIAVYPSDGVDEDSFIKNGEFAMSNAKQQGQNTYQFFDKSLNTAAFHKLLMENSLRRAIERDELLLYYQPKIDMRKMQIIGCEALLRWQHPELGMISPTQFIPIAEDSGLIIELSNWALKAACVQMKQWQERGISLGVAVNISAKQFRQHGFAQYVRTVLEAMGIAPRLLKLELTESTLLEDVNEALVTLSELCLSGIRISIDDFGTGYSSLAYLKKLPISELKIDRSFLKDIPYNQDDMAIINAILALARSLSIDVVAEGVEHEEQVEFLLKHGCDTAQGFLYSKPISACAFEEFIREWKID